MDELDFNQSRSFNLGIARQIGLIPALIFDELSFWSKKGKRDDGWIYKTTKDLIERLPVQERSVRTAITKLVQEGYVEKRIMKANGAPTMHFRITKRLEPVQNRQMKPANIAGTIRQILPERETEVDSANIAGTINSNTSTNNHQYNEHSSTHISKTINIKSSLNNTLEDFTVMRKAIKKPLTLKGKELIIRKLQRIAPNDGKRQVAILEQSIENSWQGVFDLKEIETAKAEEKERWF